MQLCSRCWAWMVLNLQPWSCYLICSWLPHGKERASYSWCVGSCVEPTVCVIYVIFGNRSLTRWYHYSNARGEKKKHFKVAHVQKKRAGSLNPIFWTSSEKIFGGGLIKSIDLPMRACRPWEHQLSSGSGKKNSDKSLFSSPYNHISLSVHYEFLHL